MSPEQTGRLCTPSPAPWPQRPQPWGGRGHWCPQPLQPPNCCCGDPPHLQSPPPWTRAAGQSSKQGQGLLCQPVGMAVSPGKGRTSGLVHFGGNLGPAKGQSLTLEILGHPPPPHPEAPPAGGGVPTPGMSRLSRGAAPPLVCPPLSPRLFLQPCLHLPQPQPTLSLGPIFYVAWRSPAPPPRPFVTKYE